MKIVFLSMVCGMHTWENVCNALTDLYSLKQSFRIYTIMASRTNKRGIAAKKTQLAKQAGRMK